MKTETYKMHPKMKAKLDSYACRTAVRRCLSRLVRLFPWRIVRVNVLGIWEIPVGHPAYAELAELRTENNRLREKLRDRLKHLRAANKGAECNARVIQLQAARMALRSHRDSLPNKKDQPISGH